MLYKYIGRQIQRYRKRNGLTQEQLAEIADISASFMGHIERGTRKLSVDTLHRIANALNCSADDLMGGLASKQNFTAAEELLNHFLILAEEAIANNRT